MRRAALLILSLIVAAACLATIGASDARANGPGPFSSDILTLSGPSSYTAPITAGDTFSVTVTVYAASSGVDAAYTGTVHFTSSDPLAVLPDDYTFTSLDAGVHTFTGVTLKTCSGETNIYATDVADGLISDSGFYNSPCVNPAPASQLAVYVPCSGPATVETSYVPFLLDVVAKDPYGNTCLGYSGAVHFTSSDPLAVLPADCTLSADPATGWSQWTFSGVTLGTPGPQTITAIATGCGSTITGTTAAIEVTALPPTISSFSPESGPVGTSVTLYGTNFQGVTAVGFNGVAATAFSEGCGGTQIRVTVPAGAVSGPITVTTPGGTVSSADAFTVDNTSAGSDQTVVLPGGVTLTFSSVITPGLTSVTESAADPVLVPTPFLVSGLYYDIETSATYSGTITVTVPYLPAQGAPQLLHFDGTSWVNVTPAIIDTMNDTITGTVSSLSPFAVGLVPAAITTSSPLPDGTYGSPYSQTLGASGCVGPCTWSIASGALPAGLSLDPTSGTISGTATAAGPSAFTVEVADSAGNSATAALAITITKAVLTVRANDAAKTYGQSDPAFSYTLSGFTNGDTAQSVNVSGSPAIGRAAGENVGSYPIDVTSVSGMSAGNYSFAASPKPGICAINPAPLTISAVTCTKTYDGTTTSRGTPTVSGLQGKDTVTGLTQAFASPNVMGSSASTLKVTGSTVNDGNGGANYTVTTGTATGTITPAPLTISAGNQTKNFGATLTSPTTSAFATSGLLASDSVSSVALTSTGAAASAAPGTYSIVPSAAVGSGLGNYAISYVNGTLTVVKAPTAVALMSTPAQYSDVSTFTATVSPAAAGGSQLSGTVQFAVNGTKVGSPVAINSSGVAGYNYTVTSPQGSYPVTATFTSSNAKFASPATAAAATMVVSPEDASVSYTGDTLGTVGSALNLQATVIDSAAVGYIGLNPETGAGKTIGDITKMWIAFAITPVGGSTSTTIYAQVLDTGTVGDGIGTASATFKASSTGSYTVLAELVAGSSGGANQYYSAPNAQPATITFAPSSGEFATGAGWITDPATLSRGFFGLNAFYNSAGKAQGQFAYVWSGTYNGVPAFFTITSNALTALGFSGSTYPLSATLSGTATLQVNKASNFALLYGPETKLPFTVSAYDTGKSSGVGLDKLSLTLTGSKASFLTGGMKSFSGVLLGGGNVVIHLK
jgi:hypothetical protein